MPELPPLVQRVIADVSAHRKGMAEARAEMEGTGKSSGGMADVVKNAMSKLGDSTGGVGKAFKALGVDAGDMGGAMKFAVAGGAVAAGVALAEFGLKSVKAFADATAQVRQFQRVSGATAEDSSKLVFAAKELGIESDTAAAAMFKLSKNVATHADTLRADGVQIATNRQGNTDLMGTLFNVADAYNRTQDQVQKNKIVFDAFGRSGAALIPILQRGREGLKDLFAEASKDHQLFHDDDLRKGKEFTLATRALGEAFKGVEIEVGQQLIPKVTQLAGLMTDLVHAGDSAKSFKLPGADTGVIDHLLRQVNVLADIGNFAEIAHGHYKNFFQGIGEGIPVLGMFVHKTHDATEEQKQQADALKKVAEGAKEEELALGILTSAQQSAALAELQRMVTAGRLTQAQLDQNVAMHHAKDGSRDYVATLKELDPAEAKQIELQARIDAGLGDVRTRYQQAADAADRFKSAVDSSLGILLSAEEADLKLAQSKDRLSEATNRNTTTAEEAKQKAYDVRQATIDLIQATEADIDAKVRDSNGTINATDARAQLVAQLQQEQAQYPGLRAEIQGYIDRIAAIPPEQLFTAYANTGSARAEVEALIRDVDALHAHANFATNFSAQPGEPGFVGHSAAGRVVDRPFLTWTGEKGREVIIPLYDAARARELAEQSGLLNVLSGASGGSVGPVGSFVAAAPSAAAGVGMSITVGQVVINAQPGDDGRKLARDFQAELLRTARNNQTAQPVGLR